MLMTISTGIWYGTQQRRQRVQRIAEPARLQHHGRPGAAEIEAGGDAERLLFTRREWWFGCRRNPLAKDAQDVRQRIVGDVDDMAAAGGVEPSHTPAAHCGSSDMRGVSVR